MRSADMCGSPRVSGFASQPVQCTATHRRSTTPQRPLSVGRAARAVPGFAGGVVSATVSSNTATAMRCSSASGRERQRTDLRVPCRCCAMVSTGYRGHAVEAAPRPWTVDAWRSACSRLHVRERALEPQVVAQIDAAPGDRARRDGRVGTFDPMFPTATSPGRRCRATRAI